MKEIATKAKKRSPVVRSAKATLIFDGKSMNRVIGEALSADNTIDPPAVITSEIQMKSVQYHLEYFERIDSLLRAVNDILGAAQLVEMTLLVLDDGVWRNEK